MPFIRRRVAGIILVIASVLVAACSEAPSAPIQVSNQTEQVVAARAPSGPTVSSTDPAAAKRDTTLDVHVIGSGFAAGSRVDFLLSGTADPKIHTNSTRYVSSTELVANITIDALAVVDYRDVAVTTAAGKKGIGTEAFVVLDGGAFSVSGISSPTVGDVNSSGTAVGYGTPTTTGCNYLSFTWSRAVGARILPLPAGYCGSTASRITEGGIIVGAVTKSPTSYELARWVPDNSGSWTVQVIGKPAVGTTWLTSHGVNDVGSLSSSWKNADGSLYSWYWNAATGWKMLASPAGSTFCELEQMNDADQMVGYCHTSGGSGFYWSGPTSAAIQLPSPANGLAGNAYYISQSGTIRGSSTINGVAHSVLWIPNGTGGWSIQDLGTTAAADRNEQGSIVITGSSHAQYLPSGGSLEDLGVHLGGAVLSNQSLGGTTWILGQDDRHPAQVYWFKR